MKLKLSLLLASVVLLAILTLSLPGQAHPAADLLIYDDSLQGDWDDWPWSTQVNLSADNPVHNGSAAIAVTHSAWGGFQLGDYNYADASAYDTLHFWLHGGSSGGQPLQLQISNGIDPAITFNLTPVANTWTEYNLSLLALSNRNLYSLTWFNNSENSQAVYYLDDIRLTQRNLPTPVPTATQTPAVGPTLNVNAATGQRVISPLIYGINYGLSEVAAADNLTLRRWGGNSTSRYNWQINTSNTGMDWYYENIVQDESADAFITDNQANLLETILTLPMTGWVAKTSPALHPFNCGFKVSKYGAQQFVDPWDTDCGNGVLAGGADLSGNDPLDTSIPITASFSGGWVNHLVEGFGSAAEGGVQFYALDNEPMLRYDTHRDVHPEPTSYDELLQRSLETAAAVKAVDPEAQILGPALWGWTAYFWSALDWETPPDAQHANWWEHPQDRLAHGNTPFVAWYLAQMQIYEDSHDVRLLDYLDLHYYPQAAGVALSGAGDAATQARRLRSTRSLWDANYSDESWIAEPVYLLPRMRAWVDNYYPGTGLALTEYNWGGLEHINGALAQADVLGIFGREGLDMATLWSPPATNEPGMFAFRMYRNYDGAGGLFGNLSVAASSTNQDDLAIYAALRQSDNTLTIQVINKTGRNLSGDLNLSGFQPAATAAVYRYSSANLQAIVRLADQAVKADGFSATYPAQSITLYVLPSTQAWHKVYLPLSRR